MMKKTVILMTALTMAVGFPVSAYAEESREEETVTIKSLNGNQEEVDLEVPYDAERIAVMDMASLDILDSLGLGERVVGTSDTSLEYLRTM